MTNFFQRTVKLTRQLHAPVAPINFVTRVQTDGRRAGGSYRDPIKDMSKRLKGFEIRKSVRVIHRSPLNILNLVANQ